MHRTFVFVWICFTLCAGPEPGHTQETIRLDRLFRLPDLRAVHQFSSHNKRGHNGDDRWRLYDDEHGDAVIFDVEGPGCVRSMWSTDIREGARFKFYFDGEAEPRYTISMLDFYQGKHPLFPPPLNSYERRGRWGKKPFAGNAFTPIPFARSLKITVSGDLHFYHVLYDRYPHGTWIQTFTGKEDRRYLLQTFQDPDEAVPLPEEVETVSTAAEKLDPGQAISLLDRKQPGCIRRIVIEGEATDAFLRETGIRMRWDDHPLQDVSAPLGFFFGSAVHPTEMQSLPLRVERLEKDRVRLTARFPMPFWKHATVRLMNLGDRPRGPVRAAIQVSAPAGTRDRGSYFTTCYRKGQTTYGRDWLFFESPGAGWFVGAVQSMQGEHYCEGDEHMYLDGAVSPQIHGTGSEDYYLGCFWPNLNFNSPFACCVGDIQEEGGGTFHGSYAVPSCYARYHLEAPIPFFRGIDARIQHGGFNTIASRYESLAFAYLRPLPSMALTDFIDVASPGSEAAHEYRAEKSSPTGPVTAHPEGDYLDTAIRARGRAHDGGGISFVVALDPENKGVRLRRLLDQGSPRQTADVFIDGERVGTWYHPDYNEFLRWYESDFDIHPRFTAGKDRMQVELAVRTGGGRGRYTDFRYEIFSFVP